MSVYQKVLVHESGHATVARLMGFTPSPFLVFKNGQVIGGRCPYEPHDLRHWGLIYIAGMAAEYLIFGETLPPCGDDDSESLKALTPAQQLRLGRKALRILDMNRAALQAEIYELHARTNEQH